MKIDETEISLRVNNNILNLDYIVTCTVSTNENGEIEQAFSFPPYINLSCSGGFSELDYIVGEGEPLRGKVSDMDKFLTAGWLSCSIGNEDVKVCFSEDCVQVGWLNSYLNKVEMVICYDKGPVEYYQESRTELPDAVAQLATCGYTKLRHSDWGRDILAHKMVGSTEQHFMLRFMNDGDIVVYDILSIVDGSDTEGKKKMLELIKSNN